MSGAKKKAADLHEEALQSLSGFGREADYLRELGTFIVQRKS
jgi:farnesyl diphosphate synthase